jgi:putative methionine-R-sulfoxide reductase with GAF domain
LSESGLLKFKKKKKQKKALFLSFNAKYYHLAAKVSELKRTERWIGFYVVTSAGSLRSTPFVRLMNRAIPVVWLYRQGKDGRE